MSNTAMKLELTELDLETSSRDAAIKWFETHSPNTPIPAPIQKRCLKSLTDWGNNQDKLLDQILDIIDEK